MEDNVKKRDCCDRTLALNKNQRVDGSERYVAQMKKKNMTRLGGR